MLLFHVSRGLVATFLAASAFSTAGCEGIVGPSRLEQAIAAEQKAIVAATKISQVGTFSQSH